MVVQISIKVNLNEQWAAEFLQLYPGANILAATKRDFQPANRKAFCARIATGEYDAVIIGHSQFEKIPLSLERQRMITPPILLSSNWRKPGNLWRFGWKS